MMVSYEMQQHCNKCVLDADFVGGVFFSGQICTAASRVRTTRILMTWMPYRELRTTWETTNSKVPMITWYPIT